MWELSQATLEGELKDTKRLSHNHATHKCGKRKTPNNSPCWCHFQNLVLWWLSPLRHPANSLYHSCNAPYLQKQMSLFLLQIQIGAIPNQRLARPVRTLSNSFKNLSKRKRLWNSAKPSNVSTRNRSFCHRTKQANKFEINAFTPLTTHLAEHSSSTVFWTLKLLTWWSSDSYVIFGRLIAAA